MGDSRSFGERKPHNPHFVRRPGQGVAGEVHDVRRDIDLAFTAVEGEIDAAITRIEALENAGPGGGVTDHGDLTGLGDDDHTQYFRADGTRAMSGTMDLGDQAIINSPDVGTRISWFRPNANYYTVPAGPMDGANEFTYHILAMIESADAPAMSLMSKNTGSAGFSLRYDSGFMHWQVHTGGGARTVSEFMPTTFYRKWILWSCRYLGFAESGPGAADGTSLLELGANGILIAGQFTGATDGAYVPGAALTTIGARPDGAEIATRTRISGVAAGNEGNFGNISDHFELCYGASDLVDDGSTITALWSVRRNAPGATWAPVLGVDSLTRVGGAVTVQSAPRPRWW